MFKMQFHGIQPNSKESFKIIMGIERLTAKIAATNGIISKENIFASAATVLLCDAYPIIIALFIFQYKIRHGIGPGR